MTAPGLRWTPFRIISSKSTPLEKTRRTNTFPVVLSSFRVSYRIQAFLQGCVAPCVVLCVVSTHCKYKLSSPHCPTSSGLLVLSRRVEAREQSFYDSSQPTNLQRLLWLSGLITADAKPGEQFFILFLPSIRPDQQRFFEITPQIPEPQRSPYIIKRENERKCPLFMRFQHWEAYIP